MRIRFVRHSLISRMAACVLPVLCLVQSNVRASHLLNTTTAQPSGTFTLTFNGQMTGLGVRYGDALRRSRKPYRAKR